MAASCSRTRPTTTRRRSSGFGGAATCLGGAIRDPLSGRSYVYQAMRITGAGDPRVPYSRTRAGKLPQRQASPRPRRRAIPATATRSASRRARCTEYYHPGFVAKRMELGAVDRRDPARPRAPRAARTGRYRDAAGRARPAATAAAARRAPPRRTTRSRSTTCGAEVQKGNAPDRALASSACSATRNVAADD